jgi:DNA-binding NtrC family response regulator
MKTVMVVDKDNILCEQIKQFLKEDNVDVISASSNRKAIELLEELPKEQINLLLIETILPGSTNAALFCLQPSISMKQDDSNLENFLQKPFTKDQLRDFIKKSMDQRELTQQH